MTPSFSERQASRAPSDQPCSHRALIQEDPGDATASTQREDSREPVGSSVQWDASFQPETRMCSFILFSEPRCPFCALCHNTEAGEHSLGSVGIPEQDTW